MRPRLVYWNNIPSPYLTDRLERLSQRGNLRVEGWFNARTGPEQSWRVDEADWSFAHTYLTGTERPPFIPAQLRTRPVPDLLVSLYAEPCFALGSMLARRRGARTAYWVESTFDSWVRRRRWKNVLKSQLFARTDAILTTGDDGRAFATRCGADPTRIHTLNYFAHYEYYATRAARLVSDRDRIRAELGLTGVTFLYVGRFWSGKGLDHLLDAYQELASDGDIHLLLVGDGMQEAHLRRRCRDERIPGVLFPGFSQREELVRFYAAADVFVFPTLGDPFGQVVGEAASCGLPIISTSAAGEIRARIKDGVSGYIVPPANSAALLDRMRRLAHDPDQRTRMGKEAASQTAGHTLDGWCREFEAIASKILGDYRMAAGDAR
jgi:glycosyltransferase involved in cell wall biosynthesis